MIIPLAINNLLHNSFLQGAGLIGMGGTLLAYIKTAPANAWYKLRDFKRRTVTIDHKNQELLDVVLDYIHATQTHKIKSTTVSVNWEGSVRRFLRLRIKPHDNVYRIKYKGKTLHIHLDKPNKESKNSGGNSVDPTAVGSISNMYPDLLKSVTLYSYFLTLVDIHEFIQDLVNKNINNKNNDDHILIYNYKYYDGWTRNAQKANKRYQNSLIFNDHNIVNNLKNDIQEFLKELDWYKSMNIPHRRGYMLSGKPGNGKSSLIKCLASELTMDIALINLGTIHDDEDIDSSFSTIPDKCLVVIEDIDRMFSKDPNDKESDVCRNSKITLSGLLNSLDGIGESENRIIIMTTNHIEKLNDALIREGRCDVKLSIDNPSRESVQKIYSRFFPTDSIDKQEEFCNQFKEYELSMAAIQEKLLIIKKARKVSENI